MLIIGHRGAAGLAQENTLEALRAGFEAGADILEFDIRPTKDGVLILNHDFHTLRTHGSASIISHHTLKELQERVGSQLIVTFEEVLDEFLGKILLNVEIKGFGTGKLAVRFVAKHYIKKQGDWDNLLFSSFLGSELVALRKESIYANLALLQHANPFVFIGYQRRVRLSAVGFHRLYTNKLALEIAKRAGIFTYAYTVNRASTAALLTKQGIDAIVTDNPLKMQAELHKYRD
jgi:glycerophosphoryl diester phosphodiesterase